MATSLLEVNNLKTRFHTPEGTVYAVNGVSFRLEEGETLAVVGESGCGKSVTMMSILGLIPMPPGEIASGTAFYRGSDLLKLPEVNMEEIRGGEIAMVFQDSMTSLNPVLTVRRQISESLMHHWKMGRAEADQKALQLLTWVNMPDPIERMNWYPHQFSGGMRQRIMIAMALACSPTILIADEPTTALDVTIQAQIVELVQRLREEFKMALIWITHDLGVVAGLADRVIVMYAGYIVEEANVFDLYEDPRHPYALALLNSIPRPDRRRDKRLMSIPGAPPNLLIEPKGCPFAARCTFVQEICHEEMPPLTLAAEGHRAACWVDVRTGGLR
jgi:oligopeptide transport system ATP-binding protein